VAAIDGACFGGGLELALACNLRVCSRKARLGLTELSLGLIPGLGGIPRLIRVVGEAKALELMLLGDIVSADAALDLGLVSRVFPGEDFLRRTRMFVRTILGAGRDAVAELIDLVSAARQEHAADAARSAARRFVPLAREVLLSPDTPADGESRPS
jgi:enoyl-CoA hydratase/carnithine racemase